jgi:copper oxidase (laccase) domain-containing protein
MRAEVAAVAPRAWSETSWGTPALDVGAGVRAQLEALGVHVVDLADAMGRSAACTLENDDLYSYRRQGQRSGRLGGLVRLTGAA